MNTERERESESHSPNRFGETRILRDHLADYEDENGMKHPLDWSRDPRSEASHEKHTGKGPKNYHRTDPRIYENICEALLHSADVDPTDVHIQVTDGIVLLTGEAWNRREKFWIEDIVSTIGGVKDVINQLKVKQGIFKNRTLLKGLY